MQKFCRSAYDAPAVVALVHLLLKPPGNHPRVGLGNCTTRVRRNLCYIRKTHAELEDSSTLRRLRLVGVRVHVKESLVGPDPVFNLLVDLQKMFRFAIRCPCELSIFSRPTRG